MYRIINKKRDYLDKGKELDCKRNAVEKEVKENGNKCR